MKVLIVLSLFAATVSAGFLPEKNAFYPVLPMMDTTEMENRITNGEVAQPGQFPYQVGLYLNIGKLNSWCGGTLISDRWILTAAHCTDQADGVTVYLGATNITSTSDRNMQKIYVSKSNIFVHESWDRNALKNDISLIKMPVKITFNDFIQPASLPKKNGQYSTYEGETVVASGWGKDADSSQGVSQVLRFIEVPVMNNEICNRYFFGQVGDSQICISTKGYKSTCNGDSGGPLVYKDGEDNIVIGATSFGISLGCEIGWPGVFTRVTAFLDWIEDKTGIANH